MKKFVDEMMAAPNVLRIAVDRHITEELAQFTQSRIARWRLFSKSPPWSSDIRWYSAWSKRDFSRFRSIFERLGVAPHVEPYLDLENQVRLYNAQLVVRSKCTRPNFHVDWIDTNNEAFTLMTPLTNNCGAFGMLYKKLDGSIGEYEYKLGEALIFGDDFIHSTKPGESDDPVVLLCFNFGTDKMKHWPTIERTAARQCLLTCRPDGLLQRLPMQQQVRNVLGRILRRCRLWPVATGLSAY